MRKVFSILVCLLLLVGLTGCGCQKSKKPITSEDFSYIVQEKEYEVIDTNGMIDDGSANVAKAGHKGDIVILFFVLSSEEKAIELYEKYEIEFKSEYSSGETISESGKNFSKYLQVSNGMISITSRISDTYIYINVSDDYEGEIKNLLKELGY